MVKFPEAEARLFKNMFVCRRCKKKIRASNALVIAGDVLCRSCKGKALRPVRKK